MNILCMSENINTIVKLSVLHLVHSWCYRPTHSKPRAVVNSRVRLSLLVRFPGMQAVYRRFRGAQGSFKPGERENSSAPIQNPKPVTTQQPFPTVTPQAREGTRENGYSSSARRLWASCGNCYKIILRSSYNIYILIDTASKQDNYIPRLK
jgi:hypothetical protein